MRPSTTAVGDVTRGRLRVAAGALLIALAGCGGGADELLETARLEEVQNNHPHARELYQEVVRRYPGTPQARTAEERLRGLPAVPPS